MPSFIIKIAPTLDLYVDWSTVVDAPCTWGTRAEMITEGFGVDRLERADLNGSSCIKDSEVDGLWWWGDDTFIYLQEGIIRRAKLPELLNRLATIGRSADLTDLLEPFDANVV